MHFQIGLPFEFFLANLALMQSSFIPVNELLIKVKCPNFKGEVKGKKMSIFFNNMNKIMTSVNNTSAKLSRPSECFCSGLSDDRGA